MFFGFTLIKAALVSAAFLFAAAGCAGPESFGGSRANVVDWAEVRGFETGELIAGPFRLLALMRQVQPGSKILSVYIEGDGAPWMSPWHPPSDPTPLRPVALAMASADAASSVVYLGRPCQYLSNEALENCASSWWMERRFSPEVLSAYDEALTQIKTRFGAKKLRVIGYSGGGVIAALLAARRSDVDFLVTVAAPLALSDWVEGHSLSHFAKASDPIMERGILPASVHWAGDQDKVVPVAIVEKFVHKKGGRIFIMPGYDHECCWARDWASLMAKEKIE